MGKSLPPPATVNLVDSFARRRGEDVEIVLADPTTTVSPTTEARLRRLPKGRVVTFAADRDGARLVLRGPRASLADGTWAIRLRDGEDVSPLDARLLVQGERPLVLLWGATGRPSKLPDVARPSATRKAVSAAGRVLDRALGVLPPERAAAARTKARRVARKVLR